MKKKNLLSELIEHMLLYFANKKVKRLNISTPEREDIANGLYSYEDWRKWHNK